jgi:hypothetical protein
MFAKKSFAIASLEKQLAASEELSEQRQKDLEFWKHRAGAYRGWLSGRYSALKHLIHNHVHVDELPDDIPPSEQ